MAVVERALWRIDGQHLVVGADAVLLRVRIRQRSRLKHLVIAEPNACAAMQRNLGIPDANRTSANSEGCAHCGTVILLSQVFAPD